MKCAPFPSQPVRLGDVHRPKNSALRVFRNPGEMPRKFRRIAARAAQIARLKTVQKDAHELIPARDYTNERIAYSLNNAILPREYKTHRSDSAA
jgi:hypothetical protein